MVNCAHIHIHSGEQESALYSICSLNSNIFWHLSRLFHWPLVFRPNAVLFRKKNDWHFKGVPVNSLRKDICFPSFAIKLWWGPCFWELEIRSRYIWAMSDSYTQAIAWVLNSIFSWNKKNNKYFFSISISSEIF